MVCGLYGLGRIPFEYLIWRLVSEEVEGAFWLYISREENTFDEEEMGWSMLEKCNSV